MASGHVNRIQRPNTWLHRPMLQNVRKALANPEPSTHDFGYQQQFSEPCDLTAWGKHQSERFTAAISPKSKKWRPRMNRSRLLVVSYRVIWSKKRATSGAFFGRL